MKCIILFIGVAVSLLCIQVSAAGICLNTLDQSIFDCLERVACMEWSTAEHPELTYVLYGCDLDSREEIEKDIFLAALLSVQQILGPSVCDGLYNELQSQETCIEEVYSAAPQVSQQGQKNIPARNPALDDRTAFVNIVMGNQGEIKFQELTANGTNIVSIQAPASLATDYTLTLPGNAGSSGQVLTTNGSGVLSWVTPSNGDIVNGGQNGPITVGTNNVTSVNLETNNITRLTIDSSGNTTFSSNYKMRAYRSTNQTLGVTNTPVIVVFNSEAFDPNNNYNTGNGVYTAPVTGYYLVSANITLIRFNGPDRTLQFYRNGTPIAGTRIFDDRDNDDLPLNQTALIELTAGDALTIRVSGDNSDFVSANNANLSVHFMST